MLHSQLLHNPHPQYLPLLLHFQLYLSLPWIQPKVSLLPAPLPDALQYSSFPTLPGYDSLLILPLKLQKDHHRRGLLLL